MKKTVVFDTAIGTSNLGDEIILQCLEEELAPFLGDSFIMRFGTHVKNFGWKRFLFGSQKISFSYEADYKIVMGTNLLSRDIKKTQAQWPIGRLDSWLYENCIMAGVGTTLSEGEITNYSRKIYNRILRKDFYHSVRDEESKRLLEKLGYKVLNTGCPTLWKLTPEHCSQIPVNKADNVIFSLSGYKNQRSRPMDEALIDVLRKNYDNLIFWCQTSKDEEYLDKIEGTEDIPRIYSLKKFKDTLENGNVDYVGTRLHGGVYALQHKVRSIVIAIDHRARGFHETNNLCICERDEIPEKLSDLINSDIVTDIRLRQDDIDKFKAQFFKEHEIVERKTHEDMFFIKMVRFPKKSFKTAKMKIHERIRSFRKKLFVKTNNDAIEKGKVMFFPFQGEYTCNLKYIGEEITRRNLPLKQVWVSLNNADRMKNRFPSDVSVVKFGTREYYEQLCTSQVLIENAFNFSKGYFRKKKGQTFIQTMHGSLGIKKIGPDVVKNAERNKRGFTSAGLTDICISNSSFETMVYRTSFWKNNRVEELGHARNDIFFADNIQQEQIRNRVCGYYSLGSNVNMALFAPTYRNSDECIEREAIDFTRLKAALEARFGGTWVILNRAHHSDLKNAKRSTLPFVIDAGNYPDIQELMIAVDLGITDYSSWIYDYVLSYKPGVLFVPDLDSYDQSRGFYYPIEETPYPICRTNDELVSQILSLDVQNIEDEIAVFLKKRGCVDDGNASKKIVDMIWQTIDG